MIEFEFWSKPSIFCQFEVIIDGDFCTSENFFSLTFEESIAFSVVSGRINITDRLLKPRLDLITRSKQIALTSRDFTIIYD